MGDGGVLGRERERVGEILVEIQQDLGQRLYIIALLLISVPRQPFTPSTQAIPSPHQN